MTHAYRPEEIIFSLLCAVVDITDVTCKIPIPLTPEKG